MNSKKVAIIVPTYNESQNLEVLIPRIFKYLKDSYVLVVDDKSTDGTEKIISNYKKKYKKLIFISRQKKDGRGTAVFHGFIYAMKNINPDYYIEMDADLSHDPKDLSKLVNAASNKHIIIGSRYVRGGRVINIPLKRKILSKTANFLITLLLSLPANDNTDGYRLYPGCAIKILKKHKFVSKGFVRIPETTYILMKHNFMIKEVPITFIDRTKGGSKVNFHEIFTWTRDILRIRFSN